MRVGEYGSDNPHDPASLVFKEQQCYPLSFFPEMKIAVVPRENEQGYKKSSSEDPQSKAIALLPEYTERPFNDPQLPERLPYMSFGERVKAIADDRGISDQQMAGNLEFSDTYAYRKNLVRTKNDGTGRANDIPFIGMLLSRDPSWFLTGMSFESARETLSWGRLMWLCRLRMGKKFKEMVARVKRIDPRFSYMKEENMMKLLYQFESEKAPPARDIHPAIERAYGLEGYLPVLLRERTRFQAPVAKEIVAKVEDYFLRAQRARPLLKLNEGPYYFESPPGVNKNFGKINLYIPALENGDELYDYLLIKRHFPLLGTALAIYPKISDDERINLNQLPLAVYLPSKKGPMMVRMRQFYLLQAFKGRRKILIGWASVKTRICSRGERLLGVNIDANVQGRFIYFHRELVEPQGYTAGDLVLLKPIVLPNRSIAVAMFGLKKSNGKMELLLIFNPDLLAVNPGYYHSGTKTGQN